MPLNIMQLEDIHHAADMKTDAWLKAAEEKFLQPYTDTDTAVRLVGMVRQADPEKAEEVRLALGGEKHG